MKCVVCHSANLSEVKNLGNFRTEVVLSSSTDVASYSPLSYWFCPNCKLIQLKEVLDPSCLYKKFYWQQSGLTHSMTNAHHALASKLEKNFPLNPGEIVLDIGSNDGTFLRAFNLPGVVKVGFEPANNLAEEGKSGLDYFFHEFWNPDTYQKFVKKNAKIITVIDLIQHISDPLSFMKSLETVLDDEGVIVVQSMFIKNMLVMNDIGNLNHEHITCLSLSALDQLLGNCDLEIFNFEIQPINGQSYRFYIGKRSQHIVEVEKLKNLRRKDEESSSLEEIMLFFERVDEQKLRLWEFLDKNKSKIFGYGFSRAASTLIQYMGLSSIQIERIIENNSFLVSKYAVGAIPVVSSLHGRIPKVDHYMVFPYGFINEYYEREVVWRERGGKFILPFPEFRIID